MAKNILITNDDGIHSDGIVRLARAAVRFGSVWVIAPDGQRSVWSHTITLDRPLDVIPVSFEVEGVKAYSCTGTPADCVRLASRGAIPYPPDVVLSGINSGYNVATDIQYSATVAAAFEAEFQGIRGIALSENDGSCHEVTDEYLDMVLSELIDADPGTHQVWNVNFPGCRLSECRGVLRDRVMSNEVVYEDSYDPTEELDGGGVRYTVRGKIRDEAIEGTDFHAILNGFVTIGRIRNIC